VSFIYIYHFLVYYYVITITCIYIILLPASAQSITTHSSTLFRPIHPFLSTHPLHHQLFFHRKDYSCTAINSFPPQLCQICPIQSFKTCLVQSPQSVSQHPSTITSSLAPNFSYNTIYFVFVENGNTSFVI